MNWLVILYNVLSATLLVDAAANTIASGYMIRLRRAMTPDANSPAATAANELRSRRRFSLHLAVMFACVAAEAWVSFLTLGQPVSASRAAAGIITARILSRVAKTVGTGALTLYLLGYLNGGKHDHS